MRLGKIVASLVLDSSVVIDILRHDLRAFSWMREQRSSTDCFVSVVTVAEVLQGCRGRSETRKIEKRLAEYSVLHITKPISEQALRWVKVLRQSHGVGYLDCLIGATASHHGMAVCTLNRKHFAPMKGLRVIVPY